MENPTQPKMLFPALGERGFADLVRQRSHTHPQRCLTCMSCVSACPFLPKMDCTPVQVIRLALAGQAETVLRSSAIWGCVACHTCSFSCPAAIDIAAVMDALRHIALERGIPVAEPDVLAFHREVMGSIERYGRTHKLEIMMRFKFHKKDFFSDMNVGLKMLAKRKLDLLPSRIKNKHVLDPIFRPEQAGSGPWEG